MPGCGEHRFENDSRIIRESVGAHHTARSRAVNEIECRTVSERHLSPAWRLAIALASGAALALAYPDYSLAFLGWFAIAGLMFSCLGATPKVAAGCGLAFGVVLCVVSL